MKAGDDYDFPFDENFIREVESTYSHKCMREFLNDEVVDRGMGCLFGAFIGDSLGSYLEFAKEKDYDNLMKKVMDMPGGGVFNVKAGQITDDSELAFHLLKALASFHPENRFDAKIDNLLITIANEYLAWFESRPFDIGITCRKGLAEIAMLYKQLKVQRNTDQFAYGPETAQKVVKSMLQRVYEVSKDSQSNGSLMRIAPLPFYLALITKPSAKGMLNGEVGLSFDGMKSLINKETALLHPNPTVVEVTGIWVRMLLSLIKREKDSDIQAIYKGMKEKLESESIGWGRFLTNTYPINAKKEHIGWSKIAIGLGFETLSKITAQKQMQLNEQTYMQHIQEVLSRGGDTDTNAAIVGGMLGALVGFKRLPKEYIKKMMEVRFEANPRIPRRENRPFFYEPRVALANAFTIIRKWFPKGKL